jgi:hypothetical protein
MADSDPISSATRPHGVQPAGDADRRRDERARRRRKRAEESDREAESNGATAEDEGGEESGPRGRHLDVRI